MGSSSSGDAQWLPEHGCCWGGQFLFLAYGLFETLVLANGKVSGIPLGIMFIAVALSFSVIQVWQIRKIEGQHGSH